MRVIPIEKLKELQSHPDRIRNICILAHVDHGKTTLADSLVAANAIISARMVGQLRYMDSRPDEQERGITMKSSAMALYYKCDGTEYLVNMIDSPGHIDFCGEVTTGTGLSDGCIVLVDVVEGVCPQTNSVLRHAWKEGLRPILVLNKIDRMIIELKMSTVDAYNQIQKILQQVNAIAGELFVSKIMKEDETAENRGTQLAEEIEAQMEELELQEEELYFSPEKGNVIFGSALDGWGFSVTDFADLLAAKFNISARVLQRTLWGDYYLDMKTKRMRAGAGNKGRKPNFVQFVLDNIWTVYDEAISGTDKERFEKILKSLNIKLSARDQRHSDPRIKLKAVMGDWLPMARAILNGVCRYLPAPTQLGAERCQRMMFPTTVAAAAANSSSNAADKIDKVDSSNGLDQPDKEERFLPAESRRICADIQRAATTTTMSTPQTVEPSTSGGADGNSVAVREDKDPSEAKTEPQQVDTVVFVSKMFAVESAHMPQNRRTQLTPEEMQRRRIEAKRKAKEEANKENAEVTFDPTGPEVKVIVEEEEKKGPEYIFLGFGRVFSGILRTGQSLYLLPKDHDVTTVSSSQTPPANPSQSTEDENAHQIKTVTVDKLYILMGREIEEVDRVGAGNIVGISGLGEDVLRNATLSTSLYTPLISPLQFYAEPIVRVSIEPKHPNQLPQLLTGLKLLRQADPCVKTFIDDGGSHVIVAAGEIHLDRCVKDLRERYAHSVEEFIVSEPIIPFQETIVPPPKLDRTNELIEECTFKSFAESVVEITTTNGFARFKLRAFPLPSEIVDIINRYEHLLHQTERAKKGKLSAGPAAAAAAAGGGADRKSALLGLKAEHLTEAMRDGFRKFRQEMKDAFQGAIADYGSDKRTIWGRMSQSSLEQLADQIWALGPRKARANILFNAIPEYQDRHSLWDNLCCEDDDENQEEKEGDQDDKAAGNTGGGPSSSHMTRKDYDQSVVTGFQLRMLSGPLCEEPIRGVGFIMEEWTIDSDSYAEGVSTGSRITGGPLSGQIITCTKEACKLAFQQHPQRLVAAMYSCVIQATTEVLGKVYAVLSKRQGRVLGEEMNEGTNIFQINATLPVVESFGFADEIRKRTSGLASPQLVFSHWEEIDMDPFWVPTTEEELSHWGEKADADNRATIYMNKVRKRKGLHVDEKIVETATKQRTLTKMK